MPGNIWNKPASPHALDDEFESTTLDPSWDYAPGGLDFATPIDPYSSGVTPSRVKIHTDMRPSWLTCQGGTVMSKLYPGGVLPTNCLIWARIAPYTTTSTKVTNDYVCGIWFSSSSGGLQDSANSLRLYLRSSNATRGVEVLKAESGAFSTVISIAPVLTRGLAYEYVCLHKIGSNFHSWAMTSGGVRTYLGSTTHSGGALDRVCIHMGSALAIPGTAIHGFDFFRVVESATYLP
jgi:hypothetical protein